MRNSLKKIFRRSPATPAVVEHQEQLVGRFGEVIYTLDQKETKLMYHITTVLDRLPNSIKIVYDIGAFNGMWSKAFAIYTQGEVYSFEPNPEIWEEFKERTQHHPNIYLQPVACGAEEKEAVEYIDEHKGAASSLLPMLNVHKEEFIKTGNSHPTDITVIRLDTWMDINSLPTPDLLKLDVQGYETKVIEGGRSTFSNAKYIWCELSFKELYESGSTFSQIYSKINALGFELIDCVDLVRSKKNDQLLYMDGIFQNTLDL